MAVIELLGISGGADLNGIVNMGATWHTKTLADTLAFISQRGVYGGLPMTGATFEQDDAAEFVIKAKYEGFPPDGGPTDVAIAEFSFDGTQEKERIETHPDFPGLKEKFGWDEENRMFPEKAPDVGTEDGLSGSVDPEDEVSPVAGQDSWLVIGAEYSVSYASRYVPGSIFLGIGTIVRRPPGIGYFNLKLGKRNFLKLSPRVTKRGNAVQIALRYQLSGPRGAPEAIYSAGQLDPEADSDSTDLPLTFL